ncbi:MAG: hypothetical protein GF330_03285 [Candidatus Eisenbacteria bacterium]|nr:hypothetical protein [Candidatus Eisenbacteria bacterium]
MFGVGSQELLIILLAVLLLFGSRRIPEVARSIGSGLQTFRRVVRDAQREIDLELLQEEDERSDSARGRKPGAAGRRTSASRSPRLPRRGGNAGSEADDSAHEPDAPARRPDDADRRGEEAPRRPNEPGAQ